MLTNSLRLLLKTFAVWPRISTRTSKNVSTGAKPALMSAAEAMAIFNSTNASDSHRLMHFEQRCCIGVIRRDLQQYRRNEQIS
jgi:hypothetical protein